MVISSPQTASRRFAPEPTVFTRKRESLISNAFSFFRGSTSHEAGRHINRERAGSSQFVRSLTVLLAASQQNVISGLAASALQEVALDTAWLLLSSLGLATIRFSNHQPARWARTP